MSATSTSKTIFDFILRYLWERDFKQGIVVIKDETIRKRHLKNPVNLVIKDETIRKTTFEKSRKF